MATDSWLWRKRQLGASTALDALRHSNTVVYCCDANYASQICEREMSSVRSSRSYEDLAEKKVRDQKTRQKKVWHASCPSRCMSAGGRASPLAV